MATGSCTGRERSLHTRLAASEGPLMACTYLHPEPSGGAGELCFSFHHAAIDAVSGLNLLHELLGVIRDLQDGVPVAAESLEAAASAERYLPPRATALPRTLGYLWRQLQDAGRMAMAIRGERRAPLHLAARCRLLTVEIDADITRQLVQRSRRQRLGLASLLAAAMLLAVHRHLYAGASRPLRNVYFVDLRPHLEPPVASQDLGCYIAMLRLTAGLHASEDPTVALWRLARAIHEDVYRAAKRGDKFVAATTTRQAIQMALTFKNQRLGATALSYAGPAPLQKHYGDIQVEKLHAFISNNVLGPEYTGQARLLNGVLGLDIVYLDEDMEPDTAESIAESMVELLHRQVAS